MSIETLKARLQHAHGSAVRQQSGETRMNGLSNSKHLREKCESGESETGDASLCESDASLQKPDSPVYYDAKSALAAKMRVWRVSPIPSRSARARGRAYSRAKQIARLARLACRSQAPFASSSHDPEALPVHGLPKVQPAGQHVRRRHRRHVAPVGNGQQVEPADQWHYCAFYQGPQVSKDVWVWPRSVVSEERSDEASAQR